MANLITNGDFTAGSNSNWSASGATYFCNDGGCETGVYPDGMVLFQNESLGGMRDVTQYVYGMVAGRTYTLSYYAKQIGRYDAWAAVDYWETNGTLRTINFPSKESELRSNQWVKLTFQFVWPTNVQSTARICIRAGADSWNGWTQLLVDKVVLDDGQGGGTSNLQVSVTGSPTSATVGTDLVWRATATGNVGTVNWYCEVYSPSGYYGWASSANVTTPATAAGTWYAKFTATDSVTSQTVTGGYITVNGGSGGTTVGPHTANNTALTGALLAQNAKCVYDYMRAKGWSKNAICGMLGNMEYESTINPGRYGSNGTNTNVFGLTQWNPGTKYTNWAALNGYNSSTLMKGQLERILYEITAPSSDGQWFGRSPYTGITFRDFTTSTDSAANLASVFRVNYENSGSGDSLRRQYATNWFNTL